VKRKEKSNSRMTVIGKIESFVKLEPAPPAFANYLTSLRVFDDMEERNQKAISDFYFYVKTQLFWVARLGNADESSPPKGWRPPRHLTPATREKLKSISDRLSKLIDMVDSEGGSSRDLLLNAQSKLKEFRVQPPPRKVGLYTGQYYLWLCDCAWLVRPPAVAYAFFVLLRKHGRPPLTKRQVYERIGCLQQSLFGVNIETDSIRKMVSLFSSDECAGRIKRFLMKVEKLPPFKRTK
jgi:hypothetical protein